MHHPAISFKHELSRVKRLVKSDYPPLFTARSFALSIKSSREPVNQDCYLAADHFPAPSRSPPGLRHLHGKSSDPNDSLFVVADGQGDSHQGMRASGLAIEVIDEYLRYTWHHHQRRDQIATRRQILNALRIAFDRADQFLWNESHEEGTRREMAASVTAACSYHGSLFLGQAGDTQAFLWRAGNLHRLTRPTSQSVTGDLDTSDDIEANRQANLNHKYGVIGGHRAGVHVRLRTLDLEPNDYLILCTKGLLSCVRELYLGSTISANPDPQRICEMLVAEAEKKFVHDDATVVVARFALAHE
ncbi:protein phosphatase 2C domain-containing protein [soil metagenome]